MRTHDDTNSIAETCRVTQRALYLDVGLLCAIVSDRLASVDKGTVRRVRTLLLQLKIVLITWPLQFVSCQVNLQCDLLVHIGVISIPSGDYNLPAPPTPAPAHTFVVDYLFLKACLI